ncbi:MAG TPA: hypothetical protein VFT65_16635 [Candidatus Angelobacter sp.]|nr:hypothetical protein [Candidatus Angelobacter sp.]
MPRKILLIAAFAVIAASYGQGQTATPSTSNPAPFGGPIVSTPTASLPTPAPSAGISDAGRAGISLNNETNSVPASETVEPANGMVNATAGTANTAVPANEATPSSDLAPSTSVGESLAAPAAPMSVAEISSRYKSNKGSTQNARMLTNDDVRQMLTSRTGVTMAKNMPPLGPGMPSGATQSADSQTAATQSASAQNSAQPTNTSPNAAAQAVPSSASGAQQAQAAGAEQRQNQPASAGGNSAGTETNATNATTPQIQNQQSNDAAGGARLPATSTFLPLLGVLGLASGGIGLWFRRFRR